MSFFVIPFVLPCVVAAWLFVGALWVYYKVKGEM